MKKFVILSLFLNANLYFCQSAVLYNLHNSALTSNAINKIGVTDFNNNDYEGSPFLDKEFLPSTIRSEKGTHLLRYNIYADEIILRRNDEYFKIPKNENLDYFFINDKYIIRLVKDKYYIQQFLESNKFCILRKQNIKFTQGKISENGYGQNSPSKFTIGKSDYYLYNIEEKKLIPAKRDILKQTYPDKAVEIEQYFKENNFKNNEDYYGLLKIIAN